VDHLIILGDAPVDAILLQRVQILLFIAENAAAKADIRHIIYQEFISIENARNHLRFN
jgi:hypothetical protein